MAADAKLVSRVETGVRRAGHDHEGVADVSLPVGLRFVTVAAFNSFRFHATERSDAALRIVLPFFASNECLPFITPLVFFLLSPSFPWTLIHAARLLNSHAGAVGVLMLAA